MATRAQDTPGAPGAVGSVSNMFCDVVFGCDAANKKTKPERHAHLAQQGAMLGVSGMNRSESASECFGTRWPTKVRSLIPCLSFINPTSTLPPPPFAAPEIDGAAVRNAKQDLWTPDGERAWTRVNGSRRSQLRFGCAFF